MDRLRSRGRSVNETIETMRADHEVDRCAPLNGAEFQPCVIVDLSAARKDSRPLCSPPGQTPERLLASKQATDCLQRAIADLPLTLREVFVLRDVEGVESKEICGLLKITDTNLYVRLHRARERVRRALERHFENK